MWEFPFFFFPIDKFQCILKIPQISLGDHLVSSSFHSEASLRSYSSDCWFLRDMDNIPIFSDFLVFTYGLLSQSSWIWCRVNADHSPVLRYCISNAWPCMNPADFSSKKLQISRDLFSWIQTRLGKWAHTDTLLYGSPWNTLDHVSVWLWSARWEITRRKIRIWKWVLTELSSHQRRWMRRQIGTQHGRNTIRCVAPRRELELKEISSLQELLI